MATILSCRSISKAYGPQKLFSALDLIINDGDRVGLIGPNGSGKSTLLKIISGLEDQDSGVIDRRGNSIVSYLAQEDRFLEERAPEENLLAALASSPLPEAQKVNRAQALLSRIELEDAAIPVAQLSGGWRKRLAICRALIVEPDLLVMDEPTNHLDIEGIIWLERLLDSRSPLSPPTYILVSHDRRFLETCTNRTVELSSSYPSGSLQVDDRYSGFLERKVEFLEQQQRLEQKLANSLRRETEWLRRGPKARTTKAKYRIDEAHRLQDEFDSVRRQNRAAGDLSIDFAATGRKTKKLMEVRDLSLRIGERTIFSGLSFTLTPGARIGLLGRNGCGKSSLLRLLHACARGEEAATSGSVVVADGLALVHFAQDRSTIDRQATLRRALAPEGDALVFRGRPVHVVSWAKRFLFRPDQLETPVGTLSGGEQARIMIADLMRQPADLLLLDEPTNDLDIGSLDVLEEGLRDFAGAVILVTHDRYLIDRVCDRVLGFVGDGRIVACGDYQQWLKALQADPAAPPSREKPAAAGKAAPRPKRTGGLTYREQLEYERMEEEILAAEGQCGELEAALEGSGLAADPAALQAAWEQFDEARREVERLYGRWDELERRKQR